MAGFRLFLIGTAEPLEVDFRVASISELSHLLSTARFLEGHLSLPDDGGVCPGVIVPTSRVQLIVERE